LASARHQRSRLIAIALDRHQTQRVVVDRVRPCQRSEKRSDTGNPYGCYLCQTVRLVRLFKEIKEIPGSVWLAGREGVLPGGTGRVDPGEPCNRQL
jgi:hypothetical protein